MSVQRPVTRLLRRHIYEDAMRVLQADYAADLDLDSVAQRIATSRRQLQRVFAEVGGTTFRAQLAAVRLDRAAELLRAAPALPVREVARRVGYRQPAQFAKSFRRRHGAGPAQYRADRSEAPEPLRDAA
jgi:AraC family transcriptional regulator of adaptative response / methylphosphotriester-DNA alkyltransferase methyltransferase